jgi:putative ABC transport system substrate-binding protein
LIDGILRGARAGKLPVETPTKLELVVNLKAGKARGLTMAGSLPLRSANPEPPQSQPSNMYEV